ncbi:MAG: hypothetical protein ACRDAI_04130 [Candidatus Rhabdochlamydia sp.]
MSALTNFLSLPDPIIFNQNLRNPYQNFCSRSSPSNIFSRLIVGVVIKDVTLIPVIAFHVLAGMGKLALCTTKITYSIPARLWGSIPNYQKMGKEGLVHLGFSGFHFADMFISITNIINKYPQNLAEKVDNFFARFLQIFKTNTVNKAERKTVSFANLVSMEYPKYLKKTTPKAAKDLAKLYAKNHSILFDVLYAEYLKNNEGQKKIELKAKLYAQNCIRIYSLIYAKISTKTPKEEAQALLYAKIYVHAYSKEFTKQLKKSAKEEGEKQADAYAKWFTKFFFTEHPNYLKNSAETAKEKALCYAEKHTSIFFDVCSILVKKNTQEDEKKLTILFEVYLQNLALIENEINIKPSFKTYVHKYLECLTDGRKKNARKIAERSMHYLLNN